MGKNNDRCMQRAREWWNKEMKNKRGREEVERERMVKKEREIETKGKRVQDVERSKDGTKRWMDKTTG